MPSTLRNRLSRLFIGEDYTSTVTTDTFSQPTKPSSAATSDSGFWSASSSRSRSPEKHSSRQAPSYSDSLESSGFDMDPKASLHRFASRTFKAISENIRSKAQIFYVDPNFTDSPSSEDTDVNGKHEHVARIFSSLRSRTSRSKMNNITPDIVIRDTSVPEIPHEIHVEIPDAKLVDTDICISERGLAVKDSLGSMSTLPQSLYTERSSSLAAQTSNSCALDTTADKLPSASTSCENMDPHSLLAVNGGKGSHTGGSLFVKGNREYNRKHNVPSPYRRALLLSDEAGSISPIDRSDDEQTTEAEHPRPIPARSPLRLTTSFSTGLSDMMIVASEKVATPDTVDIEVGQSEIYDADAESSSELSEAPSMGPRSSWDKARADRQRRYQVVRSMSAETASDHSDDSGLELRSFSDQSQPMSADTSVSRSPAIERRVRFETGANVDPIPASLPLRVTYSVEAIERLSGRDLDQSDSDHEQANIHPDSLDVLRTEPRSKQFRGLTSARGASQTQGTNPARLTLQSRKSSMLSDSTSSSCAITTSSPLCYQPIPETSYHVHTHHVRRTSSINDKIGHTSDDMESEKYSSALSEPLSSSSQCSHKGQAPTPMEGDFMKGLVVTDAYANSFRDQRSTAIWSPWPLEQMPLTGATNNEATSSDSRACDSRSIKYQDIGRFRNVVQKRPTDVFMIGDCVPTTEATSQQQTEELESAGTEKDVQLPLIRPDIDDPTCWDVSEQRFNSPYLGDTNYRTDGQEIAISTPRQLSQSELLPPLPASSNTPYHETSSDIRTQGASSVSSIHPEFTSRCIAHTDNHQERIAHDNTSLASVIPSVRPVSVDFSTINPELDHYLAQAYSNAPFRATESEYSDEDEGFRTPIATPSKRKRIFEDGLETPKPQTISPVVEISSVLSVHIPDNNDDGFVAARLPQFGPMPQLNKVDIAEATFSTPHSDAQTAPHKQDVEPSEWTPQSPGLGQGHRRERSWHIQESSPDGEEPHDPSAGAPTSPLQTSSQKKGVWWARAQQLYRKSESPCPDKHISPSETDAEQTIESKALQVIDACINHNTRLSDDVRAFSHDVRALLATAHIFGNENSPEPALAPPPADISQTKLAALLQSPISEPKIPILENSNSVSSAADQEQEHDVRCVRAFFAPALAPARLAAPRQEVEAAVEPGQGEAVVGAGDRGAGVGVAGWACGGLWSGFREEVEWGCCLKEEEGQGWSLDGEGGGLC
ncbi:hypothetical protein MMC13_001387 [Lambiella insularis]|nr:hypothetical protein [Lambiella insularis]